MKKNKNTIIDTAKQTIIAESNAFTNLVNFLTGNFENDVKFTLKSTAIRTHIDLMLMLKYNSNMCQILVENNTNYVGRVHLNNLLKEGLF